MEVIEVKLGQTQMDILNAVKTIDDNIPDDYREVIKDAVSRGKLEELKAKSIVIRELDNMRQELNRILGG